MFGQFVRPSLKTCRFGFFSGFIAAAFFLSGCDLSRNYTKIDRASNMEFQDFRDGLAERAPEMSGDKGRASSASSIPALQPYISDVPEGLKPMPLVSLSVNQSVPLQDILFELAQQAEYDLELDPRIQGSIIFTARDKPFDLVIERICDIAGLRYKFKDDILRVELDVPYNKIYKIDYLNHIRESSGSISNDISVVSGDGTDTGSSFETGSTSGSDFWGELETNLGAILEGATPAALRTEGTPRITPAQQNPQVQAVSVPQEGEGGVTVEAPQAVLRVESLPVASASTQGQSGGAASVILPPKFSLNKQAGLINVFASEKAHKEVRAYLDLLRRATTAQVLIEAKILE